MYAIMSSHRARGPGARLRSVCQSLRHTSYQPMSFFREVFPVPYPLGGL